VQTITNVHAAAIDRSNLSVGADARGTAASQRDVPGSCRRMTGAACAAACCCVATRRVSAFGRVSTRCCVSALTTLGCMPTLRCVSSFGCVATLRGMAALRCVSAFGCVSTLRRMAALRCVSTLRCVPASAALCWGRVGRGLARTGFVLLLLRRCTSRSNCGHGEKNN
jgi:hypothetical protein